MSLCAAPKRKRRSVLASDVGGGAGADGRSSFGGVDAADCAELNYEVELEATVDASGGRYVLEPLFNKALSPRPGLPVRQPLVVVARTRGYTCQCSLPTPN
jgi:hypothetical protein